MGRLVTQSGGLLASAGDVVGDQSDKAATLERRIASSRNRGSQDARPSERVDLIDVALPGAVVAAGHEQARGLVEHRAQEPVAGIVALQFVDVVDPEQTESGIVGHARDPVEASDDNGRSVCVEQCPERVIGATWRFVVVVRHDVFPLRSIWWPGTAPGRRHHRW